MEECANALIPNGICMFATITKPVSLSPHPYPRRVNELHAGRPNQAHDARLLCVVHRSECGFRVRKNSRSLRQRDDLTSGRSPHSPVDIGRARTAKARSSRAREEEPGPPGCSTTSRNCRDPGWTRTGKRSRLAIADTDDCLDLTRKAAWSRCGFIPPARHGSHGRSS